MADRDEQSDRHTPMMDFSDDMYDMSPDRSTTGLSLDDFDSRPIDIPISPRDAAEIADHLLARPPSDSLGYSVAEPSMRTDPTSHVAMQKVGRNYRHLQRRRGAAIHSHLLKAAFEASMSANLSDDEYNGDEGTDDYSMYASNSTIASRDGIEDVVLTPRKRIRSHEVTEGCYGNSSPLMTSISPIRLTGDLFNEMGLQASSPLQDKSHISDVVLHGNNDHCDDHDHSNHHRLPHQLPASSVQRGGVLRRGSINSASSNCTDSSMDLIIGIMSPQTLNQRQETISFATPSPLP